mgnify:CR=1 FL=1
MSKSLKRVIAALEAAGVEAAPMEMAAETRTAQQAADADLLSHERLRLALESLAGASDLVVIDAPPVLPVGISPTTRLLAFNHLKKALCTKNGTKQTFKMF